MASTQQDLRLKVIVLGSAGAGKTCLLRRYTHGTFEGAGSPYKAGGKRRTTTSTLGADYYVKRVTIPLKQSNNSAASSAVKSDAQILVQLWDTAGKERLKPQSQPSQSQDAKSSFFQYLSIKPSKRNLLNNKWHRYNNWGLNECNPISSRNDNADKQDRPVVLGPNLDQPFRNHSRGDALFRHVDACMLVYDATSSMSFLHLMQWHSEWMAKIKHWEEEACNGRNDSHKRRNIPFIVVATKIDLLEQQEMNTRNRNARSIMGFDQYVGQDQLYEYAAEATKAAPRGSSCQKSDNPNHVGRLTYSLKETLWSRDAAYLDTLARIDDDLSANRQMIMVWCQRNGIPHVEASALDGRGVYEAMELLIRSSAQEKMTGGHHEMSAAPAQEINTQHKPEYEHIGDVYAAQLEGTSKQGDEASGLSDISQLDSSQHYFVYEPRSSSGDLFERYQSDDEKRCSLRSCWWGFFSNCIQKG